MDELAEKNGFQWLIDSAYKLYFFKDIAITSYRDIVQDGEFADFRDVAINSNINDYRNKIYFVGGNDPSGCVVKNIKGSSVEQNYKQAITAGSGIYGEVIRNSSETSRWSYTATTGTTATNITITGHDAVVRAYFKNRTRNLTGFVTGVTDANNFTCTSIAGQTAGDVISFYWDAYNISTIELRRTKNQPLELTFQTLDLTFRPQMRIYINLPILNIEASYWNIESVQITDVGRGYFSQIVTCVLSDGSDFNSQGRRNKDLDFFRRW